MPDFSRCRTAAECLIEVLEQEYPKYNVLSTEDLSRHFITIQFLFYIMV